VSGKGSRTFFPPDERDEMNKVDRKKAADEWKQIMDNHPAFARVFLVQQAILMEAAELGAKVVDRAMSQLLSTGMPVLFEGFWTTRAKQTLSEVRLSDQIECVTALNRDPARCFNLDPGDPPWFDDPFIGGQTLPPKPPIPPLKPKM
jgi:hypothetical protein